MDDEHDLAGWQEEGHDRPDYAKGPYEAEEIQELYASIQPMPDHDRPIEDFELEARRHEAAMNEPPAGSWASVARVMASLPQDPDEQPFDWDAWKDEMKDNENA